MFFVERGGAKIGSTIEYFSCFSTLAIDSVCTQRTQRIEYPGAIYHVISRGNYCKELFLSENTGKAFERAIFEAVGRCGWKLHAYVIMANHYHLAVETPAPNLVDGMKWLQGTFATRFNRSRASDETIEKAAKLS